MKKILIALLVCFSFVTANAKDYRSIIRTYQFRCSNQHCLASQTIMSVS